MCFFGAIPIRLKFHRNYFLSYRGKHSLKPNLNRESSPRTYYYLIVQHIYSIVCFNKNFFAESHILTDRTNWKHRP